MSTPPPAEHPRATKRSLHLRLAALFGAMCGLLGLVVLAIPYLVGRASSSSVVVPAGGAASPKVRQVVLGAQRAADSHRQLVLSVVALLVVAGVSVVVGWVLADRTLRPLRTITATTREISASNLHRRLAIDAPYDELTELGATLDDLLARLGASFASQRNFVANASHELRTPLTAERTVLQVALADPQPSIDSLREACHELLDLGNRQERLIDDLLTLAQSEGGIDQAERFDLSVVARVAVRDREAEAGRRRIEVDASCAPTPMSGDRRLVGILVGNLVDNALRHNVEGGSVTVRTSFSGRGSTVAVSNTGPIVDEADVAHLCEPFMRLGGTRRLQSEGHGLGLAIVRAVATAHHGELHIRARRDGGLAVDVTFPPVGPAAGSAGG